MDESEKEEIFLIPARRRCPSWGNTKVYEFSTTPPPQKGFRGYQAPENRFLDRKRRNK